MRRTGDADGGIPRALANTSTAHDRLIALGYSSTNSNRYDRPGGGDTVLTVDLLVPNLETRLRQEMLGGRRFDSMPGLGVALARPLSLDVSVTLSNDEQLLFTTKVPSVEGAIMLKAYAWSNRHAIKDGVDLHSLFRIVEAHPRADIGGWQLDETPARGARRDVGQILHLFARGWEAQPPPKVSFDYRHVIASIRTRVARPI